MHVSLEWIKEYVNLDGLNLSPKELMSKVTLATCEVEEVIESGSHWEQIVIAQIKSFKKHPDSDKLNLVTFEYGKARSSKTKEVVCGAPNVREGIKVPYAALGTRLPNGMVLEAKAIRGIMSEGMLCSKDELGMGGEHSGLWEMPAEAPVGETLLSYLKEHKDIILDIDNKSLTHRPDLWGIYGMAREIAAIWDRPLLNPFQFQLKAKLTNDSLKSPIKVRTEGESSSLGYFGLSIDGISVKNDSPAWMKRRLISSGLRPINNIVDISNYVMLELGIPNHIFDADQIKEEIILKRVGKKEKFTTLDGVERELQEYDTVVADASGPLVIAGIMGGLTSGVTEKTTRLFVEVANWKAGEVRKTSSRLGLRTDSSQRYEKSLDSKLMERSMNRLVELILADNPEAKIKGTLEYAGPDLAAIPTLKIETSYSFIRSRLGKEVSDEDINKIFKALDFSLKSGEKIEVTVPSYRATKDVENAEDLVEEIGRMVGFDNITPCSPMGGISSVRLSPAKLLVRKIQDFMVYTGKALEVYSYPMVGEALLKKAKWPELSENFVLTNALSIEHDRMRPSLVPSLLESVSLNAKYHDGFRLFEVGRAYGQSSMGGELKAKPHEGSHLGIVLYNKKEGQNLFMNLVDTVENLLKNLRIPGELFLDHPRFKNTVLPRDWKGSHPFEFYHIQVMGKVIGGITTVHPLLLREFKVKTGQVAIAVLDLSSFEEREIKEKNTYKALPKFPGVTFDCTVLADHKTPITEILASMKKLKSKEFKESKIVTVFPMEDKKAVTLRSLFADEERTLPPELIKELENKVITTLAQAGYALKV